MDQKDLIKYGLIAIGAYLIYKYVEANGGLSAVLSGTSLLTPTVGQTATGAQLVAAGAKGFTGLTAAQAAAISSNPYSWNGTVWALVPPALAPTTPAQIAAQIVTTPTGPSKPVTTPVATCPGGSFVNGVCTQEPTDPISQLMEGLAAAGGAGTSLDMDQWNYYYSQVTGQPSPVDPGSIAPGVYAGAGIVDRTTPTDIGTWLAIFQNQLPSAGLSAFFGLGGPRYTPAWLM